MAYSVRIKRSAVKALGRIPKHDRVRIVDAIDGLAEHPHVGSSLKGGLRGLRRIRVGGCRVVYEVQEAALVVLVVHRGTVYRPL